MAGIGHNSRGREDAAEDILNGAAQRQLKSIIERIERLNQEKDEVAELVKEVFAEAKGNGYDVKTLRKVIRIRKQDPAKRAEEEAVLDLYLHATGDASGFEPLNRGGLEMADTEEDDYSDIG